MNFKEWLEKEDEKKSKKAARRQRGYTAAKAKRKKDAGFLQEAVKRSPGVAEKFGIKLQKRRGGL